MINQQVVSCRKCGREIVRRTIEELSMADEAGLYPGEYAHFQPTRNGYGFLYPSRDGHAPDPDVFD